MAASDDEEDFAALFAASEEGRKRERRIASAQSRPMEPVQFARRLAA